MRLTSPAFARNIGPITEVLHHYLPETGTVLEVASGPGEHVCAWAQRFPMHTWVPSDPDSAALASIAARRREAALDNLSAPLRLDVSARGWASALAPPVACIVAVNLLHIAPWEVTEGLFRGSAEVLGAGGHLLIYGPFLRRGVAAPSDERFDRELRARNPAWGVRELEMVVDAAQSVGLALRRAHPMPANNLCLAFVGAAGRIAEDGR